MTPSGLAGPAGYTSISYPGALGVPPVGLTFDVPAGWTTRPMPGALAVSQEPVIGPNGFWANIVTTIDRVSTDTTLDQVSEALLDSTREGAESLIVTAEHVVDLAGVAAILREQAVEIAETDLTLVQFALVLVVDVGGGQARDCVQLIGTVEGARRDAFAADFEHLVDSVVLNA